MIKQELGNKLKELRKGEHLTQQQVADYLNVAQPIYQRFEKGVYECSYEQLVMLCDLFDVSADYLLGRSEY